MKNKTVSYEILGSTSGDFAAASRALTSLEVVNLFMVLIVILIVVLYSKNYTVS